MQANQLPSLADAPGTSREYETIYILRPNTTNEEVAQVNERVKGIIEGMGGKIIKVDNWGKRRLAYEVAKERKGIYLYWQYLATRGIVEEFERNMRMLDVVVRYMTIKLDADIDSNARPTEIDDETYERAATTAADEEDMYLARSGEEDDFFGDDDDDDDDRVRRSNDDDGDVDSEPRGSGKTEPRGSTSDGDESDASGDSGASDDEPSDDEPSND